MKISNLKKGDILISKILIIDNNETIVKKDQKLTILHDMNMKSSSLSRIDFIFYEIENWVFIYQKGINTEYLPDYYIEVDNENFELLKENRKRKLDQINELLD